MKSKVYCEISGGRKLGVVSKDDETPKLKYQFWFAVTGIQEITQNKSMVQCLMLPFSRLAHYSEFYHPAFVASADNSKISPR
jgi:hypothetical protein